VFCHLYYNGRCATVTYYSRIAAICRVEVGALADITSWSLELWGVQNRVRRAIVCRLGVLGLKHSNPAACSDAVLLL